MLQQGTLKEKKAVGERKQEKKEGKTFVRRELTSANLMSLLLYQAELWAHYCSELRLFLI